MTTWCLPKGLQGDMIYLSWPICNSAPRIWAQMRGRGGLRGLSPGEQLCKGAQIKFGDLTPYLTSVSTFFSRQLFSLKNLKIYNKTWSLFYLGLAGLASLWTVAGGLAGPVGVAALVAVAAVAAGVPVVAVLPLLKWDTAGTSHNSTGVNSIEKETNPYSNSKHAVPCSGSRSKIW